MGVQFDYSSFAMAKPALGKGLDALIKQQSAAKSPSPHQEGDSVHQLPHPSIHPSPLQPRSTFTQDQLAELVESIREHGIIQPLIVRKSADGGESYELIAGERRWRASAELGLKFVPAIIREATDREVLEMALIENLQRENLSPLEEAAGYQRLKKEFKLKQDEIAKRVGKSRATVANSMRLLDLSDDVRNLLNQTLISVGHAKVLLAVKDAEAQTKLALDVVKKSMTVRQTERSVQKTINPPVDVPAPKKPPIPKGYEKACQYLARQFSTEISINPQGAKGIIEISYADKDDLMRILELLGVPSKHLS